MAKQKNDYGLEIVNDLPATPERKARTTNVGIVLANMAAAYEVGQLKAGQWVKLGEWGALGTAAVYARKIVSGAIRVPDGYDIEIEARRYMSGQPEVKVSGLWARIITSDEGE